MPTTTSIGIDLGTSNTCAAVRVGGKTEIIPNGQGERTTPSVVTFSDDGATLVGTPALRQAIMNPQRTITGVKRLVGRRFDAAATASLRETAPYEIAPALNGDAWVKIGNRLVSPPEVQAYILERVRESASRYLGGEVRRAVITVPAFFGEIERRAVRDAAEIAGLEPPRILAEPTAAAIAYGYAQREDCKILVVDLGGGTMDATIMTVRQRRFEVLASAGDLLLGGADFDRALAVHLAGEIERAHGADVLADPIALQRLISEAEAAKIALTSQPEVTISLPFLIQGPRGNVDLERRLGRAEHQELTRALVDRIVAPCRAVLADAGIAASELDDVILVGGMTRSPAVQQRIAELFGRRPSLKINPDEAVAIGAGLLAASLDGGPDEVAFVDVAARSIGLRAAGDRFVPLIQRATPLPATASRAFATTTDGQTSFHLQICEGEDPRASKNQTLANVSIAPIAPRPAGEMKVAVTFTIAAGGAIAINARAVVTAGAGAAETRVEIAPSSGLGRAEVERLADEHRRGRAETSKPRQPTVPTEIAGEDSGGFSIEFREPSRPVPLGVPNQRAPTGPTGPVASPMARAATAPVRAGTAPIRAATAPPTRAATAPPTRAAPPTHDTATAPISGPVPVHRVLRLPSRYVYVIGGALLVGAMIVVVAYLATR